MKTPSITYQIRVRGHFDATLIDWFAPLALANEPDGDATLTGPIRDQAELYGILLKLYNLNFTLIAVQQDAQVTVDALHQVIETVRTGNPLASK